MLCVCVRRPFADVATSLGADGLLQVDVRMNERSPRLFLFERWVRRGRETRPARPARLVDVRRLSQVGGSCWSERADLRSTSTTAFARVAMRRGRRDRRDGGKGTLGGGTGGIEMRRKRLNRKNKQLSHRPTAAAGGVACGVSGRCLPRRLGLLSVCGLRRV